MINVTVDTSELKAFVQNLPQLKDQIFDLMRLDIREISASFLENLMNVELSIFLGSRKTSFHSQFLFYS